MAKRKTLGKQKSSSQMKLKGQKIASTTKRKVSSKSMSKKIR